MRRVLPNTLWALSLLVGLLGAAVWGRSYFWSDVVTVQSGRRTVYIFSDAGKFAVVVLLDPIDSGRSWTWHTDAVETDGPAIARALAHFEWTTQSPLWKSNPPTTVAVPQWTVPAVFGVLPGVVHTLRRCRRKRPGCCPTCGYDLTGNVSGVCPECGNLK